MKNTLLSLLKRKTSSNYFIPEIDGFRFFAIFTVLLYHLNTHLLRVTQEVFRPDNWLSKILAQGSVGVDVFFGISGFILALPFARQHLYNERKVDLKSYYVRRITRLEPPYVISLLLFLMVHVVILHENFPDILPNFLASLFYVHNIVFDQWSLINPVAWSLEVEVQFYLLAPLLAGVFLISNTVVRRAVIAAVILVSIVHYNYNYEWIESMHLRKSLLMHLHQFFIGFLFADVFLVSWANKKRTSSYLYDVLGMACMSLLLVWNQPFVVLHDIFFSIALLISFICIFKGVVLNKFYTHPVIVVIGGMCYSIYLLHYAAIAFLVERTKAFLLPADYWVNFLVQAVVVLPVILLIGAVFFVMIERPCMDKDWPAKLKAKVLSIFSSAAK